MASYEDTLNALGPVAFWRLNESSGTVMSDSSGNGHDGTFFNDCVFGLPSPIETDPSSLAISGRVGQAAAPDGGDLDVRSGSTIGGWILFRDDFLAGTATLLCREAQWGVLGGFSDLVDPSTGVHGTWYFLIGKRNGSVMRLKVNDVLVAERSDLNVSGEFPRHIIGINGEHFTYAINGPNSADAPWLVGVSGVGSVWAAAGVDEPFIFNYPTSDAEDTAIYESALNALFLSGTSNVVPTAVLDGADEPDPIQFAFRHNWTEDLIERISFQTDISQALSGPEESKQVRLKPRREIEINQMLRDNSERRALRAKLWPNQHLKWFVPMLEYRDYPASLANGATNISLSTLYKDYEIGEYAQFREFNGDGQLTKLETIQLSGLAADSITLVSGLVNDYTGHIEVCPARRAYLNISSPRGHTDAVEDLTITARLLAEDEKTTPNRITSFISVLSYKGFEVFKESLWQSNDWTELREYEIERSLTEVDFGSGVFGLESDTPGAQESFSYRIWIKGLELNASFLGWFYERAGSLNYLWVPSMQRDFEIISVVNALVTVSDTHYSDNYALAEARRDLAFVYNDGSIIARRVTGFEIDGVNEILTLDTNAPTLTNLRSLSLLKFCRLDADTLEIAKRTNDLWIYQWRFRELIESPA